MRSFFQIFQFIIKPLLFFLFFFSANIISQTLIKNNTQNSTVLSFDYIQDINNEFTSKNVLQAPFKKVTEPDINWGKKNGFYWFKVLLKNNKTGNYAFHIPTIHIDSIKVYKQKDEDLLFIGKSGNKIAKTNAKYLHNYVTTSLQEGIHTFYMQASFKHEAYFPLQIEEDLLTNNSFPVFFLYYGFSLMMILLNSILYFFFREKVYISYAFFLTIISFSLFYDDGLFALIFPSLLNYFDSIELYIHWLTSIGATWFCFSFLNIKTEMPKIRKWFFLFIGIAFVLYSWSAISFSFKVYKLAGLSVYIVFIGTWLLPVYFFKKYKHVRILVFAYLIILFSSMGYFLLRVEGIQFIKITPNFIKIGGVIEIMLITISILYRFKALQKESYQNKQLLVNYLNSKNQFNTKNAENDLKIIEEVTREFSLTKREEEILQLLIQQQTNKQISENLHISIPTVKFHISNILGKLNFKNRNEVIKKLKKNAL